MFSKELENLIQATLEDGVLEDYEKAALVKRAQAEGVDIAELQIYINSILQKRQRELAQQENAKREEVDRKKKEAFGRVCPNCGRQVPPMTLMCECGFEFTEKRPVSSVQLLSEKIEAIMTKEYKPTSSSSYTTGGGILGAGLNTILSRADEDKNKTENESSKNKEIINAITMFPVPNTKEDIVEFCALAIANSKLKGGLWGTIIGRIVILSIIGVIAFVLSLIFGGEEGALIGVFAIMAIAFYGGLACSKLDQESIRSNKIAMAWRNKFEQVIIKGRSMRGDTEFTQQLDYYESLLKTK